MRTGEGRVEEGMRHEKDGGQSGGVEEGGGTEE